MAIVGQPAPEPRPQEASTPAASDHAAGVIPGLPERLLIERPLGTGGFGAVFVVFDKQRGERLALKKLERVDPSSLYRFKQEFRAMADLRHPKEGLETVRPVLAATGIEIPRTPKAALFGLIARRLRLKLRDLAFREHEADTIRADDLRRIDLCWSLSTGLVGVDLVRSADFQARNLALALDAGEPLRIARALALQAIISALENLAGVARGHELAARAQKIAARLDHPEALAWARSAAALIAWSEANIPRCVELCEEASAIFRERCRDSYREMGSLETWFNLHGRFLMGQIETVALRASACVAEARARARRAQRG
jgi:hypothetical protein